MIASIKPWNYEPKKLKKTLSKFATIINQIGGQKAVMPYKIAIK